MSRRVLIEADGGSRGNPGPAAYGAVLKDAVTGEYRGSTIIERYVDFEDGLPDFAHPDTDPAETLDRHCKMRVIMNRKFAP